jgi:hypothetical protein
MNEESSHNQEFPMQTTNNQRRCEMKAESTGSMIGGMAKAGWRGALALLVHPAVNVFCCTVLLAGTAWGLQNDFDECQGGTALASSDRVNQEASKAFNDATGDKWWAVGNDAGWIRYQLPAAKTITSYTLTSADSRSRDPKDWMFQGSNDGSSWFTLDTRSGETFSGSSVTKTYTFANTTAYSYYRVNISAVATAGNPPALAEIEMFEAYSCGFTATPVSGTNTLPVTFTATTLNFTSPTYKWDINNDGSYELTGTSATTNYTYTTSGSKTVKLRVEEGANSAERVRTSYIFVADVGTLVASLDGANDKCTGGTATANNGTASDAFNESTGDKWFPVPNDTGWIAYQFSGSTKHQIGSYTLTTADYSPRDPKQWTLEGSDDGTTWTVVDTRVAGCLPDVRYTTYAFTCNGGNSTAFNRYRVNIASVRTAGNRPAIAEIQMFLPPPPPTVTNAWPTNGAQFAYYQSITATATVSGATSPTVTFWTNFNNAGWGSASGFDAGGGKYTNALGTLTPGSWQIYTKVEATEGTSYSSTNTFDVNALSITLNRPLSNSTCFTYQNVAGTATVANAEAPCTVTFQTNFASGGWFDAGTGVEVSSVYGLDLGTFTAGELLVRAIADDAGTATATSAVHNVTIANPTLTVSMQWPNGQTFAHDASVTTTALVQNASGGSTSVTFYATNTAAAVGSVSVGVDQGGGLYAANFGTLTNGSWQIYATVDSGSSATSGTNFFTVALPPSVSLTSPTPNQSFTQGATIPAVANPSGGSGSYTVYFYTNSSLEGTYGVVDVNGDSVPPYSNNLDSTVAGDRYVYAMVVDSNWKTNYSAETNKYVITTPPYTVGGGGYTTNYTDGGGTKWRAHVYTNNGTLTLNTAVGGLEYLVVAGGGGGGGGYDGGGGGAGGVRFGGTNISAGVQYTITVGAGGKGAYNGDSTLATNGGSSSISNGAVAVVTATGGGFGGSSVYTIGYPGVGGSGGGGCHYFLQGTNGVSGEGNKGGDCLTDSGTFPSGGGGGAGAVGGDGSGGTAGSGGAGTNLTFAGPTLVEYARGGDGSVRWCGDQANAAANTGNGGNGGSKNPGGVGGNGGSGIVVVRYVVKPITLDAPTNNQVFGHNASIVATATVSEASSPVVTFWTNSTSIAGPYWQVPGQVSSAPYTNLLGVLPAGTNYIYAMLVDGSTTNYTATNTFVVKAAPSVYVTLPTNNQQYTAAAALVGIEVTAVVSNGIGPFSVQFYTNANSQSGAPAGAAISSPPYTLTLAALGADDNYQIYAVVTDQGNPGDTATSVTNDFVVQPTVLTVMLNVPTNGAEFPFDATIAATATVYDATGSTNVMFWTNTVGDYAQVGATGTASPYGITFAPVAAGTYHIYATVDDDNGSATSATHTITVHAAPTVTLAALAASYNYGVSITATATCANGLSPYSVQFYTNSTLEGTCQPAGDPDVAGPDYTVTFGTLFPTSYYIYAEVTDGYSDTARTVTNSFTVNPPPAPVATLAGPTDGQSFWFGDTITATSSVSGGTPPNSVQFYTNGVAVGSAVPAPYTITLSGLPVGTYTIYATVTDAQSRQHTTATHTFYVAPLPTEIFVVQPGTAGVEPNEPYAPWSQAATNIQQAVDYAASKSIGTVTVSNGTYNITTQINVTAAITLRSFGNGMTGGLANAANTTISIAGGSGDRRVMNVNHANAVIDGLTMTGGYRIDGAGCYLNAGTVRNCRITGNNLASATRAGSLNIRAGGLASNCQVVANSAVGQYYGVGVNIAGGTLRRSNISNNSADSELNAGGGIGIYSEGASMIDSCVITNNRVTSFADTANPGGGGVLLRAGGGTVRNSLIAGNVSKSAGGGVRVFEGASIVENCTIVGNASTNGAGGVVGATVTNSIVYNNTSTNGAPAHNWSGCSMAYSCTTPTNGLAASNSDADPLLGAGYTLQATSPCIDRGSYQPWMAAPATDLDGNPRIQNGRTGRGDVVDMGAYETYVPPKGTLILFR